jgi:D-lactate dehydrogenase (cytochrome)
VIPYGVGSSLEGHAIPIKGGLSVDTSKMDKILHVYEEDMQVVVQPGIRRIALNAQLKSKKVFFPIDPGANATLGKLCWW